MAFDGSAIVALLDGAVSKGTVHGVAAVAVDRSGQLFHHAAGEGRAHIVPQRVDDQGSGHYEMVWTPPTSKLK
jgi:hypothetical protein